MHPVAVLLSYLTKAPLVPEGTPVVNALNKQRSMLENVFRACIGLVSVSRVRVCVLACACVCLDLFVFARAWQQAQ